MRLPWKRREQWQERLGRNKTILWEKLREALASVVPITVIVLILSFTVAPIPTETLLAFLIGAVMVILGIGLFSLGADTAMTPIGERVGAAMTRSRKLWVVAAVGFLIGVIVTVSEPDLQVLAQQVPGVPNATLVGAVAVGVGVFLVIAMLRILFRIPLNRMLIVFYILVFALALFVPEDFLAIAFDSGGVTTGPMTVPFIMALGVGVASIRSDENAAQDSFGLVALCSVGPILAVMVLALIYPGAGALCSSRSKGLMDMAGSELEFFKQKMSQVVGDLSRTMDNLNLIMEQNAANIEGTMSHLNSITGSVNGMLLSQRANLESAVANLTRFSEMLGENSPRMDSIILNLSNFTDQIQRENLAGALDSTLMNLNAILARVNAGEGTVGQLVSDPRLYESLNEATANLASLLANLQAHPARYVHFSLFGRDPEKADRKQQKKEAKHARRDSLKALKAAR